MLMSVKLVAGSPASQWIMAKQKALTIPIHLQHIIAVLKKVAMPVVIVVAKNQPHIATIDALQKVRDILISYVQPKIPKNIKLILLGNPPINPINNRRIHLLHICEWPLAEVDNIAMIKMKIGSKVNHAISPKIGLFSQ